MAGSVFAHSGDRIAFQNIKNLRKWLKGFNMQSLRNLEDVTTAFDSNASQIDRKRKTCSGGSLGKSSSHTSKRCKTLSKDILLRTMSEFPQGRDSEHL